MDLLQLLILLTIAGICGAFAVLLIGFAPRGVAILLFSIITGTIGAAIATSVKRLTGLPGIFELKVGTIRIDIIYTWLASLVVVGLLMLLQILLTRTDQPPSGTR